MMMGDLLVAARHSTGLFQNWLEASDPKLATAVSEVATREGMSPAGFVRGAIADFARLASEEDWATLISSIRDNDDPGTACLVAMVHWRLTVHACGCHSLRSNHPHEGASNERFAARSQT